MEDCLDNIKEKNKNWKIEKHDDNSIVRLLKLNPIFPVELYLKNSIPASRSDIARLVLLYSYGGVYSDLSFNYLRRLDSIFDRKKDLILLKRDDFDIYKGRESEAHYANGIMACKKGSKFIFHLLSLVRRNLESRKFNFDVINSTGPGVINSSKDTIKDLDLNIDEFSFKHNRGSSFELVRINGFSNSWRDMQKFGIIKPQHDREIILHVGAHKTGTTSIQRDLFLDRKKLYENKVLYPHFPDSAANHSVALFSLLSPNPEKFHVNIEKGRVSPKSLEKYHNDIIEYLKSTSLDTTWEKMIVSGESLSVLPEANIIKLKQLIENIYGYSAKIKVVYCIREPVSYHISAIQERVKGEALKSILYNNSHMKNFFVKNIKKLRNVFGNNNVKVIDFKELISTGDIANSFLQLSGINGVSVSAIKEQSNVSMTYESVILLDSINSRLVSKIPKRELYKVRDDFKNTSGVKYLPEVEIINLIKTNSQEDVQFYFEKFNYTYKDAYLDYSDSWSSHTLNDIEAILKNHKGIVVDAIVSGMVSEAVKLSSSNPAISLRIFLFCKKYRPNGPLINQYISRLQYTLRLLS